MNCKKKPISECFYLTKYRNKQKISIQQIVQLWKKLQHYLKIIIYGQICFFFLMTSDFATSYNELSLHRLRTLFSMETSIILTLNATYNETYVIQTLISIDTLTVWTVLRFHQCSQESELVGEGVSPLHFFCIFKRNNNHLISSFFSYACQDSD